MSAILFQPHWVNSLWLSDTIWWQRSGSTFDWIMVCYLSYLIEAGDAYMHHQLRPSLVQIMTCRLFGAKPLSVFEIQTFSFKKMHLKYHLQNVGHSVLASLRPSDTIWWQRSGSTLAQVMACCLTAPSHYLNQCWLIISEVQWHSY